MRVKATAAPSTISVIPTSFPIAASSQEGTVDPRAMATTPRAMITAT
jgi:hypothetical protein